MGVLKDLTKGVKKFSMSSDGYVSAQERASADVQAHKIFDKNAKKLGVDVDNLRQGELQDSNNPNYKSIKLYDGKKVVGEILIDRYSGDYMLTDGKGKQVAWTSEFGKDHHPVRKSESVNTKEIRGQKYQLDAMSGEYRMLMKEVAEGEIYSGSPKYTIGYVALVDPQGKIMAVGTYDSGGFKSAKGYGGAAELKDGVTKIPIEGFTEKTPTLGVPAILFDNSVFKNNRSEIMMHRSLREKGSSGCVCPDYAGMDRVIEAWKEIPFSQRPKFVETNVNIPFIKDVENELKAKMQVHGLEIKGQYVARRGEVDEYAASHPKARPELGNLTPPTVVASNESRNLGDAVKGFFSRVF